MADTHKIRSILESLPVDKLEGLKNLFWSELNYEHANQALPAASWDAPLKDLLAATPALFATAGTGAAFHVIYIHIKSEKLFITTERALINKLISDHPHSLFVFANLPQTRWHFVNAVYEKDEKAQRRRVLRRISVSREDRLRTASERIARLDTTLAGPDLFGLDPFKLQSLHEEAFDVEAVTEEFFEDYKSIFNLLRKELESQAKDLEWAHDFALQFMNRLMFLYYIERKRWLDNDPDFLHNFWRAYRNSSQPADTFVTLWLNLLFFNAFNKPKAPAVAAAAYLPDKYRDALQLAPWLNGGLFEMNRLDEKHSFLINDALVKTILDFLDRYNFTISEDTPLDQEVAVDPEMIGKVYESLVNVSAEADERGDAGIFYTPRVEIDLMCRLSLVDWLANHLAEIPKSILYEFVFAFSPEDKAAADRRLAANNLWPEMERLLKGVTVLDPACGSGSFLVGMLMILDDLLARCSSALGGGETPYQRRKGIVASSLYGVDIMEWAVHVAELRLWLQLVIDTEIDENELRLRPLLPNLSFKVRKGDSLVQELGGINLSLQRAGGQLPAHLKGKITALKADKLDYFNNKQNRRYQNAMQVQQAENILFREVFEEELRSKRSRQAELQQALSPARNLFGEVQQPQIALETAIKQRELEQTNESITKLEPALAVLKNTKEIPFVWDVAFVEIFEGEKGGFDIVLGNPPYIRQEKIHDPGLPAEAVTEANKRAYKEKLAQAVYAIYPRTFGFKPAASQAAWSLDKKSDYYIYFYFVCLSLLNSKGSFCFITSNSWLDVGYGSDLQQFLLTRAKVKLIIDNQVKRSFKSADVNTIIALLSAPRDSKTDLKESLQHPARFVMFKVPYENGLSPVLWEEAEEASGRSSTPEMRVVVKPQAELLESGLDPEKGAYAGDKWGGKYLRAPDIYWHIMDKCRDKLVRLGDIADVRRGITTGANEFFYLDQAAIDQWGIEDEFIVPVVRSPRDILHLEVKDINTFMFICDKPLDILSRYNSYQYVKWGENQGFQNRPTCKSRKLWWFAGTHSVADFIWYKAYNDRFIYPLNSDRNLISDRLYELTLRQNFNAVKAVYALNNSFTILSTHLNGRVSLGEGALDNMTYEAARNVIVEPSVIPPDLPIIKREILSIEQELKQQDRIDCENRIFRSIGLTSIELDSLHEAVIRLVNQRLSRANT